MASWIRIDEDLPENPKTQNLQRLLGLETREQAIGIVARLFIFTLRNAWETALLEPWGAEGIADGCGWKGDPEKFLAALRDCGKMKGGERGPGFIDEWTVGGWQKRANKRPGVTGDCGFG